MERTTPTTVTPQDIRDLLIAAQRAEAVIVDMGDDVISIRPAALATEGARILARSSELRDMLTAAWPRSVARMFPTDSRMTYDGYVLCALLVNERATAVLPGGIVVARGGLGVVE